jgi:hypothetical protein
MEEINWNLLTDKQNRLNAVARFLLIEYEASDCYPDVAKFYKDVWSFVTIRLDAIIKDKQEQIVRLQSDIEEMQIKVDEMTDVLDKIKLMEI